MSAEDADLGAIIRDGIYGDDRMSRETLQAALDALAELEEFLSLIDLQVAEWASTTNDIREPTLRRPAYFYAEAIAAVLRVKS